MYISHEHKIIWWVLESSAETKMSEILEKNNIFDENEVKLSDFPDYKVICTISNPYYRVFDMFLGIISPNKVIKKRFLPDLREKFNKFVEKSLKSEKLVVNPVIYTENDTKYFKKWVFDNKIPDYIVRIEHFYDDLGKIESIKDIGDINKNISDNLYDYRTMYDFNTAKKVYHNFKKHFYLCGYDPFSFTYEELNNKEKISFIHDVL